MIAVPQHANDVQIRARRLHHQYVRAFFDIKLHLSQSFTRIRRIHLMTAPVAEGGRRFRRFAEWPVISRGIFHRIGKNRDVLKSVLVQQFSNCADSSVHHV